MSTPNLPPTSQDILPDYDGDTIPTYTPESYNTPKYTYHLRATKSHTSLLAPYGPGSHTSSSPTYEIHYRSQTALSLFTPRKPDITISHQSPNKVVARADFHSNGPLPYCPRARLTINTSDQQREDQVIEMQALDWKQWTFTHSAEPYVWKLRDMPTCLELSSTSPLSPSTDPPIIARFTYGKVGTKMLAGGEVGVLEIWPDALTEGVGGVEIMVAGCVTAVKYFEGLGRRYRNDGTGGGNAASLIDARNHETTTVKAKFMLF